MAEMARFTTQSGSGDTVTVAINFNEGNLRLTNVTWTNPPNGRTALQVQVWNDQGVLIYDNVETSRQGQRNIPGVHQVVDDGGGWYQLPDGWQYKMTVL